MLSSSLELLKYLQKGQTPRDRINWFAGIIDGEGSFGLYLKSNKKGYYGKLQMQNTSLPMVRKVQKIVRDDLGVIRHNFGTGRRYRNNGRDSSIYHDFSWQSVHDLSILLDVLPEKLVAKREEALLFRDWFLEKQASEDGLDFEKERLYASQLKQLKVIPS